MWRVRIIYISIFKRIFDRAAGIGGSQQILALLTPTTSGLRSALKREDVDFSSPLQQPLQDIQDNKVNTRRDCKPKFK